MQCCSVFNSLAALWPRFCITFVDPVDFVLCALNSLQV